MEVHGREGEPPYLVRSGRIPGERASSSQAPTRTSTATTPRRATTKRTEATQTPGQPESAAEVKKWHVDLYLYEHEDSTSAHAVLHSSSRAHLDGTGGARLRPGEANVPEIGDEVAGRTGPPRLGRSAARGSVRRHVSDPGAFGPPRLLGEADEQNP